MLVRLYAYINTELYSEFLIIFNLPLVSSSGLNQIHLCPVKCYH